MEKRYNAVLGWGRCEPVDEKMYLKGWTLKSGY
jgi:hypothetical protein